MRGARFELMGASVATTAEPSRDPPELPALTALCEFVSPEHERQFRLEAAGRERRALLITAVATVATYVMFIYTDLSLVGSASTRSVLLAVRAGIVALCVATVVHSRRRSEPADRVLAVAVALVLASEVFIASTRPGDFLGHVPLEMIAVLALYLVVPLPFVYQAALATTYTAGSVAVLLALKDGVSVPTLLALTVGFMMANGLGLLFSRQSELSRRRAFAATEVQRQLRAEVERAVAEAETLRDMLPICSSCKRIRDATGGWHEVDEFMSSHDLARFTHGLCEPCALRLYPEVDD